MDEPRGMWPAVLPWNTTKSLADDPNWMQPTRQLRGDEAAAALNANGEITKRLERLRERDDEMIVFFVAGEASLEELADQYDLSIERVTTIIKKALE